MTFCPPLGHYWHPFPEGLFREHENEEFHVVKGCQLTGPEKIGGRWQSRYALPLSSGTFMNMVSTALMA